MVREKIVVGVIKWLNKTKKYKEEMRVVLNQLLEAGRKVVSDTR